MFVRMLVELSGPSMLLVPGDECEFPDDEAVRLIKAEYAVPVDELQIERTVLERPQETREERKRGRHRKED